MDMDYKYVKILLPFVLLFSLLFMFGSCREKEPDPVDTQPEHPSGEVGNDVPLEFIDIVRNGKAAKIVYSLNAGNAVLTRVNGLAQSIRNMTGVLPDVGDDYIAPGKEHDSTTVEILLGQTNYPESESVYETLGYGEGSVQVIGNKIVVLGTSDTALATAVSKLLLCLNQYKDGKELQIPTTFSENISSCATLSALPVLPGGHPDISDSGNDCWEVVFSSATKNTYSDYLNLLEQNGFSLYAQNQIEENFFRTYTDENYVVTATYSSGLKKVFIMIDPKSKTALPAPESENVYTRKVTTTMITQIGLFEVNGTPTNYYNGMSYVIRLEDGSFILVDGGHNNAGIVDRLYNVLREQAPDPDHIVVAAWIFSHPDGDHVGFFPDFSVKYSDKVTVEQFIFNFPSETDSRLAGGNSKDAVLSAMNSSNYNNSKKIKAHAGQIYYIRNAKIEIIAGLELLKPYEMTYGNECCVVFTLQVEGKQLLFLGDCGPVENRTILSCYTAKTLKSDFIQISHHGCGDGCGTPLYTLVAPEYAFWPAGSFEFHYSETHIVQLDKLEANSYFFNKMDINKVYLAGGKIVTIELGPDITATVYESDTAYFNRNKA